MGPVQSVVEMDLLVFGHSVVLNTLEVYSDPVTDIPFGNMLKLDTYLTAVGGLVGSD